MNIMLREKVFNFISVLAFLVLAGLSVLWAEHSGIEFSDFTWSDFILISLATFRLARMVVYEKVFSLVRFGVNSLLNKPIGLSLSNLITCPWCTSVWCALFLADLYFLVPYGRFLIYFLALSAVSAPLILVANYLNQAAGNQPNTQ